jgi:hypothetical protein
MSRYQRPVVPLEAELDGEPGSQATGQPETPPRPPGHIPAGPRDDPASGETDWVRAIGQRRL